MSAESRSEEEGIALAIPEAWREFLSSGEHARARASIHAGAAQRAVDLVARLEFPDERHLTIDLALVDGARPSAKRSERAPVHLLTARERAVITLIAMGRQTEEIAETLHISPSTVSTHVRNSMSKLEVHTRAHLVAVAMEGQEPARVADEASPD